MTTKEQERKALAQIRKIVESLGENSYVGTAFEGCFRDAEDNIEDDAAYSMKSRYETANELAECLAKEQDKYKQDIFKKDEAIKQLDADLKAAIKKQLPADLYRDLWLLVNQTEQDAAAQMMAVASTLANLADCPNDIAVQHGLKAMASAKAKRDNAASILERLEKYE